MDRAHPSLRIPLEELGMRILEPTHEPLSQLAVCLRQRENFSPRLAIAEELGEVLLLNVEMGTLWLHPAHPQSH